LGGRIDRLIGSRATTQRIDFVQYQQLNQGPAPRQSLQGADLVPQLANDFPQDRSTRFIGTSRLALLDRLIHEPGIDQHRPIRHQTPSGQFSHARKRLQVGAENNEDYAAVDGASDMPDCGSNDGDVWFAKCVVTASTMNSNTDRPCIRQVSETVRIRSINRLPVALCVPKLSLR